MTVQCKIAANYFSLLKQHLRDVVEFPLSPRESICPCYKGYQQYQDKQVMKISFGGTQHTANSQH